MATGYEAAMQRLAREIKARRLARDLTQEDVADAASMSTRHYQMLESGVSVNPEFRTLFAVAAALDTSLADLLEPGRRTVATRKRAPKRKA